MSTVAGRPKTDNSDTTMTIRHSLRSKRIVNMRASFSATRIRAWDGCVILVIVFGVLLPQNVCSGFCASKPNTALYRMPHHATQASSYSRPLNDDKRSFAFPPLCMSSEVNDDGSRGRDDQRTSRKGDQDDNILSKLLQTSQQESGLWTKLPPFKVEDMSLLFYDVFLIVNLALSISFWVTHRLNFAFLPEALSEGSLMSLLWIAAGLFNGSFLLSAKDGHYDQTDERGGPKAAGLLGFLTFLNAINLRLLFAFVMAFLQHRPVGSLPEEQIMPLEIGFGLVLMSAFRFIHSAVVPRT